ncbi:MAG: dihydrolipoamide acetyltransferase [Anaerolineae bacterium]
MNEGDIVCEVETDKAVLDVESPASGTLLAHFYSEGDDVPVMVNIAAVGEAGEQVEALRPAGASLPATAPAPSPPTPQPTLHAIAQAAYTNSQDEDVLRISPRARRLAQRKQIDIQAITGSGPMGRIIERDIEAAIRSQPTITPVAQAMLQSGAFTAPERGTGTRGRITKADLIPAAAPAPADAQEAGEVEVIPLRGVRKTIARRMLESMQTTAQLTLNISAQAQGVLEMRQWLKNSPAALGLRAITINDVVMYATVQTLTAFPQMNSTFEEDTIYQHRDVHLGFAVDTPRGLLVPVIRRANHLNMMELAAEAHRLSDACLNNTITPDELSGGTFTVSNLGNLGIETFTPVLNLPQVGILGVGAITPKPIQTSTGYDFIPHMALSLTINHQVVDGAPAARFLKQLSENLTHIRDL